MNWLVKLLFPLRRVIRDLRRALHIGTLERRSPWPCGDLGLISTILNVDNIVEIHSFMEAKGYEKMHTFQYIDKGQLTSGRIIIDARKQLHVRFYDGGVGYAIEASAHIEYIPEVHPIKHLLGKECVNGCHLFWRQWNNWMEEQ